jgi:uncharacterized protein YndB with AHSA1/START domain
MERGSLEKEIHIAASPAVVYEVISRPEHIRQWWTEQVDFVPTPGRAGRLFVPMTVVEAIPGQRFVFRWDYPQGEAPTPQNSMLVTFQLTPEGDGTRLKVVEDGFRERGWEAAVLEEEYYRSHDRGWDEHLADLATYAATLATR